MQALARLKEIINTLMGPDGCPWDRKQTFESLRQGLREEIEEIAQAVENQDHENLQEEIGDVLSLLFLYAGIGEKRGLFTLEDIGQKACDKLIFRHPHVFGGEKAASVEEAQAIWNRQKRLARKGAAV